MSLEKCNIFCCLSHPRPRDRFLMHGARNLETKEVTIGNGFATKSKLLLLERKASEGPNKNKTRKENALDDKFRCCLPPRLFSDFLPQT